MKLLRSENNVNKIEGYSFVYINDMAYYSKKLDSNNTIWIASGEEIFRNLKSMVKGQVFLDFIYNNGSRPSNILALGQSELETIFFTTSPTGLVYYEESFQVERILGEFLAEASYIFEFAHRNQEAKLEVAKLKEELKGLKKEEKEAKREEIKNVGYEKLSGFEFRSKFSIPTRAADIITACDFLFFEGDTVLLRKVQDSSRINYEERFAEFYKNHAKSFESNEFTIDLTSNNVFNRKSFESIGEPRQPLTEKFLILEAETLDFSESFVPDWESDSSREVEKPALPLPNAHLVNALTSGMLQGSIYTSRGETLIKGSTIKVEKRIGDTVEDFFENRQMVFYSDEYTLSRENSSTFIEQNLRELSSMLKSIGQTVNPSDVEELLPLMKHLAIGNRPDLPGQVIKTIANYILQLKYGFSIYNGEPGIGKTQVSFSVARLLSLTEYPKGMKVAFICDGAKHLKKMLKEAGLVIGQNATVKTLRTLKNLDQAMEDKPEPGQVIVYVVSKDTAKRETAFKPITNLRKCPSCGVYTVKKDVEEKAKRFSKSSYQVPQAISIQKNKSMISCGACGDKLVIPSNKTNSSGNFTWGKKKATSPFDKPKGFKPAESFGKYLRRKMKWKKLFDFLIVDEAHGMTADHSAQTQMMRDFVKVSRKTMLMTGTLSNGYSSSLYYLLYAVMPKRMKEWGFDIENKGLVKWIDSYGARKKTFRRGANSASQEKAIINPTLVMHHLAPFTVWGKIEDLNYPMPKYSESVEVAGIEPEILKAMSDTHAEALRILGTLPEDAKPSFGAVTKSMLYMSNNPFKSYDLRLKYKGEVIGEVHTQPIFTDETYITMKERRMLDLVQKNLDSDRKVMIYTYFNKTAYSYERIAKVLNQELPNLSFAIMPESLSPEKIGDWFVSASVKHDVVIVPYKRVATGLDIPQYPEIIFYEEEYNIREILQASRRPYRAVIQKNDVHVNHLVQSGPQAIAMKLISEKIAASKIVEGEVYSEEGVESFAVDSIEIALKQRLAEGVGNLEVPNFATTEIEEGRGRPWTTLEQTYIDLIAELNEDALKEIVPETVTNIHTAETEDLEVSESEEVLISDDFEIAEETAEAIDAIDIIEDPVVFGYVIINNNKRKKVTESGILPEDVSELKSRLTSEEKVQLTFF